MLTSLALLGAAAWVILRPKGGAQLLADAQRRQAELEAAMSAKDKLLVQDEQAKELEIHEQADADRKKVTEDLSTDLTGDDLTDYLKGTTKDL